MSYERTELIFPVYSLNIIFQNIKSSGTHHFIWSYSAIVKYCCIGFVSFGFGTFFPVSKYVHVFILLKMLLLKWLFIFVLVESSTQNICLKTKGNKYICILTLQEAFTDSNWFQALVD